MVDALVAGKRASSAPDIGAPLPQRRAEHS